MKKSPKAEIGIIGGTGLYEFKGLKNKRRIALSTPFGKPSDAYVVGEFGGRSLAFLPRHGNDHGIIPSEINFRANICGFKMLGAKRIIAVSAVGSMKENIHPTDIVFPDQFFDRTKHRAQTFFGSGVSAHISFAEPVCAELRGALFASARKLKLRAHNGGTYLCIEGPQFSTYAESRVFRSWGVSVIGMTNMPEARLAREAEICYSTMALVTDYDCWHDDEEAVNVEQVVARLQQTAGNARKIIAHAISKIPPTRACPCKDALKNAVLTPIKKIPASTRRKLKAILKI